jgi:hypothetical protein
MTTLNECNDCWYVPGEMSLIDVINPETGLTFCCGDDATAVLARHPNARRMSVTTASDQIDRAAVENYCQPVRECTEADFQYCLEVLPPVGWKTARGVQSFKMSERTFGNITNIYAECGGRFFCLSDRITMSADEIAERVGAYIASNPVSTPIKVFDWL